MSPANPLFFTFTIDEKILSHAEGLQMLAYVFVPLDFVGVAFLS